MVFVISMAVFLLAAVADDMVYLECPINMHATFVDAETLEVIDSISEDELMVFEIDVK